MKGIILAGGNDNRLFPVTKVVDKHLLPVFDKPMIFYPIETFKNSGIHEILIICNRDNAGDLMQLLGNGDEFGIEFTFKIQKRATGTMDALSLAESFTQDESVAVIFGDNIFENSFVEEIIYFQKGAQIFVKKTETPDQFNIVELDDRQNVVSIEEKPLFSKSDLAVTGFAIFEKNVFSLIKDVKQDKADSFDLKDLLKAYQKKKALKVTEIHGMWADAGTHERLLEASLLAQEAFNPRQTSPRKSLQKMSSVKTPFVSVGIATFNSEKYIKCCLDSLFRQNYDNFEIVIFDNNSADKTVEIIRKNYDSSRIRIIESDKNLGFSRAHNEILRTTDSDFYACLNIDMIFEPNFIEESVYAISKKANVGAVGGKIKKLDFDAYRKNSEVSDNNGKTNFIDSVGLKIYESHRFENIGEGDVDYGQFDEEKEVFGFSGAAVFFRRKALDDIAFINDKGDKEFFDEEMFLYKEDIDLAYRLQWAGWKALYHPKIESFHDRTVASLGNRILQIVKNRDKKPKLIKRVSFLNHRILLRKNFSSQFSLSVRLATFWYNFKTFAYITVFETELLTELWKIFRLRNKIAARKKSCPHRVSGAEIEKLMEKV